MNWNDDFNQGLEIFDNHFEYDIFSNNDIEYNKINFENFFSNNNKKENNFENTCEIKSTLTSNEIQKNNKKEQIKQLFKVTPQVKLNIEENNNNNNNSLLLSTHSKTENLDSQNLIFNEIQNNFHCYENKSIRERMKLKIEKTKKILEKKIKRNENNNLIDKNSKENKKKDIPINEEKNSKKKENKSQLKKETKMLRNRLSAQKSRDKKKKEFEYYKKLSQDLLKENSILKEELEKRDYDINLIKESIKTLCPECKKLILEKNISSLSDFCLNNKITNNTKKYINFITGIIAIICVFIGTFILGNNIQINHNNNQLRHLNQNINCNCNNQLIPYDNVNKYINNQVNETNKQFPVPFKIEKDYTVRAKKFLENNYVIPINYPLNINYNNFNMKNSFNEKNYVFCTNFYSQSEELFNNLYNEKQKIDKAITTQLNFKGEKYIGFEDRNIFMDLIVPVNNYNNNTSIQVDNVEKSFYTVSCKIVDIKKGCEV